MSNFGKCPRCKQSMYKNNKGKFPKHTLVIWGVWPEGYNARTVECSTKEIRKALKELDS